MVRTAHWGPCSVESTLGQTLYIQTAISTLHNVPPPLYTHALYFTFASQHQWPRVASPSIHSGHSTHTPQTLHFQNIQLVSLIHPYTPRFRSTYSYYHHCFIQLPFRTWLLLFDIAPEKISSANLDMSKKKFTGKHRNVFWKHFVQDNKN